MKKLLILFAVSLIGCSNEEEPQQCQCYKEIIYWNNGTELYIVEKTIESQHKCDLWEFGANYIPYETTEFEYRFVEECE
jgi:hypothetical protein